MERLPPAMLCYTELADQFSHEADALEVVFQADILVRSVRTAASVANASRESRCS